MVDIDNKVTSNAKDQRRSRSVLPTWGDIYRLRDLTSSHAAAPLNTKYSHLLQSRFLLQGMSPCLWKIALG